MNNNNSNVHKLNYIINHILKIINSKYVYFSNLIFKNRL